MNRQSSGTVSSAESELSQSHQQSQVGRSREQTVKWDGLVSRESSDSVSSTESSGTVSSAESQVIRSHQQSQVGRSRQQRVK